MLASNSVQPDPLRVGHLTISLLQHHVPSTVGAPIPVQRSPRPSREQVDQLHELYVERLTQLFEEHKTHYGVSADQDLVLA